MRLYVIRHAIAEERGTAGIADDDRPLTKTGRAKMRAITRGLKAIGLEPAIVLSSPLPRARQTAEILVAGLGGEVPLELIDALRPEGSRPDVYREIRARSDLAGIALVGHQPSLGEIAGEIACGSAERALDFKKGGACAIELERLHPRPRGALLWLLTPAILVRAGGSRAD